LRLPKAKLWHFDHPNLYRLEIHAGAHRYETTFGVRQFEVRGTAFYPNGERVWLMGVERMAGSRPDIGMAESEAWIRHDHDDMKELNCVFTRVHWPQDRRRLITYASNSLKRAVEADVAGEMDFIELNEYYETWYGQTADSARSNLECIHRAFPNKPVVISEHGLCECHPAHTGGDGRRIQILQTHTRIYRDFDFVGGAIFFCYNDYRTHMGDKGRSRFRNSLQAPNSARSSNGPRPARFACAWT